VRAVSNNNTGGNTGCSFVNIDSVSHNITATATCCRVPGRN